MLHHTTTRSVEAAKANFDQIYAQPDPREYFRVLYGLDYVIPELARPIFSNLISALEKHHGRSIRVLDIGCSYGINAALATYPICLDHLAGRYAALQMASTSAAEIRLLDRSYFHSWPGRKITFIGLDQSQAAIDYARATGLIQHGIVGNFEKDELPERVRVLLEGIDLIISTGCVGYVTEKTIRRVLDAIGSPAPWVASFVLRMYPYQKIAAELAKRELRTQKLEGVTFVQRRFQSELECRQVLDRLAEMGIETSDKEANGLLHAEFFLSRCEKDEADFPLQSIVSVTKGSSRPFGRRFQSDAERQVRLVR